MNKKIKLSTLIARTEQAVKKIAVSDITKKIYHSEGFVQIQHFYEENRFVYYDKKILLDFVWTCRAQYEPKLFSEGRRYKKAGVVFYGLEGASGDQLDLFDAPVSEHSEKLYAAIDNINERFGRKTIFHLSEGVKQSWKMKREHLSPNYTTNWDQIPVVK